MPLPPSLRPLVFSLPLSPPTPQTDRPGLSLSLHVHSSSSEREKGERRECSKGARAPLWTEEESGGGRRAVRPSFLPQKKSSPTPSDSSFRRPPPSTAGRVRRGPFSLALLLPPLARPSAPLPAPSAQLISPRSPRLSLQHEEGSKEPCLPLSPLRLGNQHWRDRGKADGAAPYLFLVLQSTGRALTIGGIHL